MTSCTRRDRCVVFVSGDVASVKSGVSRVGRDGKSRLAADNCPKRAVISAAVLKMAAGGQENAHPGQIYCPDQRWKRADALNKVSGRSGKSGEFRGNLPRRPGNP